MKRLFVLAPFFWALTLILAQSKAGVISGRLLNPNGEPAVRVRIRAVSAISGAAESNPAVIALALTDDEGRYRLEDVPPGNYRIAAGGLDSPTYHPGVIQVEKATIVKLPVAGKITGIDFPLVVTPGVTSHTVPPPLPPPTVDLEQPIRVRADDLAASCISCPAPAYPPLARTASASNIVAVNVIVDKDGAVRDANVVRGHSLLQQAAVDAVRKWRYQPHRLNGQLVEVQASISVEFTMN